MNTPINLCCSLIFALGVVLVAGCEQSDEETAGTANRENESTTLNDDGKNNNQNEDYTSAKRKSERAKSIEKSHEDMDVLTPGNPVMAYARYHTVEFNHGVAALSADAKEDLSEFVASLDGNKPAYITIRMEDADTLDVTEPTPEFKKLTATRVNQVTNFFQRDNVEIAELKVDKPGVIEAPGEDSALARESEADNKEADNKEADNKNGQLVVITIGTKEDDMEPSDTIPHSPDVKADNGTMDG